MRIIESIEAVIDAAIDYEAAYSAWWSSYLSRDDDTGALPPGHGELIVAKAAAHKVLLEAVRTMKREAEVVRLGTEIVERDKELLERLAEGPQ